MHRSSSTTEPTAAFNLTQPIAEQPAQQFDEPVAPPPTLLNRFTAGVRKCAASIKKFVDKHPYESFCVAMVLIGTGVATGGAFIVGAAILVTLGALTAGTGAAMLAVMVYLDTKIARQKGSGEGASGRPVTVDLDDPDAYRIESAPVAHADCVPQTETTIDLKPVTGKDAADDFANMFAEITGEVEKF